MPLNHLQTELLRSIASARDEGFRTDRLTLNYRRALNALFEQGLVTPHGLSSSQVILSQHGQRVLNYASTHRSSPDSAASD
jgi:hypothetical protein